MSRPAAVKSLRFALSARSWLATSSVSICALLAVLLAGLLACKGRRLSPFGERAARGGLTQGPAPARTAWEVEYPDLTGQLPGAARIAPGPDGGVFVATELRARAKVGAFTLEPAGAGDDLFPPDLLALRLDPNGKLLWARRFGSSSRDELSAVAADAQGNLYLAGASPAFLGEVPLPSGSDDGGFLLALAADGSQRWVKGHAPVGRDTGDASLSPGAELRRVVIDERGEVIVLGGYRGGLRHPGATLVTQGRGGFLARYDASGAWRSHLALPHSDDLCVLGPDRLLVVVAQAREPFAIGSVTVTPRSQRSLVLLELSGTGQLLRHRDFPDGGLDFTLGLTCSPSGVNLLGGVSSRIVLGGQSLDPTTAGPSYGTPALVRFDRELELRWARLLGGNTLSGSSLAADADGAPLVTGAAGAQEADLGGGALAPATGPHRVVFLTRLDPATGQHTYSLSRWRGERSGGSDALLLPGGRLVLAAALDHGDYEAGPSKAEDLGSLYVTALDR